MSESKSRVDIICPVCDKITTIYKSSLKYRKSHCCSKSCSAIYKRNLKYVGEGMKECNTCHLQKPLEDFNKLENGHDGRRGRCKECDNINITPREYTEEVARKLKDAFYKRTYNISLIDYEKMILDQDSLCAICKKPNSGKFSNLVVDHSHISGKVRGLLCTSCNLGLGKFKDSSELLLKAAEYLERFNE